MSFDIRFVVPRQCLEWLEFERTSVEYAEPRIARRWNAEVGEMLAQLARSFAIPVEYFRKASRRRYHEEMGESLDVPGSSEKGRGDA